MTIGKKLTVSFGAMLAVTLAISVTSWGVISTLGSELDRSVNSTGRSVDLIGQLTTALAEMKVAESSFILFSSLSDTKQVETQRHQFQDAGNRMKQSMADLRPLLNQTESIATLRDLETGYNTLSGYFERMVQACVEQKCSEALELHTQKVISLVSQIDRSASQLANSQRALARTAAADAMSKSTTSKWLVALLIAVCLAIGGAVQFVLHGSTSRLRQFVSRMMVSAEQIATASADVESSSHALAENASQQAASLDGTAATSEEISSMTMQNASKTRSAADFVEKGEQWVSDANRTLEQMVQSMSEISGSSEKISKIIKVIEEIAFQTNILALNAAVEAARAGDAGLGFAVVADEVRNLAQRCSQAAHDTTQLIEESIQRSREGSSNLDLVSKAIHGMTENSDKVKILMNEVKLSTEEQARGIEQVSQAITQMDRMTQQTATNSGASARASQEMSAQAQAMQQMIRDLTAMVGQDDVTVSR